MTAPLPDTYERPTISASRLKQIGGKDGCERKYAGAYLWGMRQSGSDATEFGTLLHKTAEVLQTTGVLREPEGRASVLLSAGAHLLAPLEDVCGQLLIEWEHWGLLPDGTPYTAYLDGLSPGPGSTNLIVVQDLKTTSDPKWALTPATLVDDLQGMLYAWMVLIPHEHWYCPPLPSDEHYGPKHWRPYTVTRQPGALRPASARLRWLYFLTRGVPRAWDVTAWVTPEQATAYMTATIMSLVAKINALHEWRARNPAATLDEIDRTPTACGGRGRWCGTHEHNGCHMAALGTPILELVLGKRMTNQDPTQDRMAALRARHLKPTAAAEPTEAAPKADADPVQQPSETPTITPSADQPQTTPAVAAASAEAVAEAPAGTASKRGRGRPRATVPAPTGGINPPEALAVLANLIAAVPVQSDTAALPPAVTFTTEQIVALLVSRGYAVQLEAGGAR